jgi:hypothetical protein
MLKLRRHPRRKRVSLPVLAPSEPIRCDRLSATVSVRTCVARWLRAQDRSTVRLDGHSISGKGDGSAPYVSCRGCDEGRERATTAANDGGKR